MKLAFIWYWDRATEIMPYWRDGLRGALEHLEKEGHTVKWYLNKELPPIDEPLDALLLWDDSNSEFFNHIDKYTCKKSMILTTDPKNIENLKKLDVVFCESTPVYEAVRKYGIRAVKAFGTDIFFYKPNPKIVKDIEYFYPATFSPWKRQDTLAHLGNKLLCVGTIQPDGMDEFEACRRAGVQLRIGYFPAKQIRLYFQRAKKVIIPAIHGSERTVLEAMACNIVPTINPENKRTHSYLDEYREDVSTSPRDFVEKFYSHQQYGYKIFHALSSLS